MALNLKRWKGRRHDKLRLWAAMIVGALVPVLACWVAPNVFAGLRDRAAQAQGAATQQVAEAEMQRYAGLIALCEADPPSAAGVPALSALRVLLVRNGRLDEWQAELPAGWQPTGPETVTAVVCLGREGPRAVQTLCRDGSMPDFSDTAGYEGEVIAGILATPGNRISGETIVKHADLTGQQLKYYATDVTVYDAASGAAIAITTLLGSDPEACADPSRTDLSIEDYLTGDRLTGDALFSWLGETLGR